MGRVVAIQIGDVYFQRYHCLSLSVAYRYLRKEWNTDIKNELSNLDYCQRSPIQSFFLRLLPKITDTIVFFLLRQNLAYFCPVWHILKHCLAYFVVVDLAALLRSWALLLGHFICLLTESG